MIEFNVKYSVKCKEKTLEEKEKLYKHLSKSYKTMQLLSNYSNEQRIYYYLDIKTGIVRKLKEVVRYYKKHNLVIDSKLVYYGTKSKATKKLEKLMA